MAVGGDLIEFTYNHPSAGSGTLFAKAGEDSEFDLGGYESEDDDNGIDGGGNMIDIMKQTRWKISGTVSWDMNSKTELEKLVAMESSPVLGDWTVRHINGTVYAGKGKPVGDLKGKASSATIELMISGGGRLKKIVG